MYYSFVVGIFTKTVTVERTKDDALEAVFNVQANRVFGLKDHQLQGLESDLVKKLSFGGPRKSSAGIWLGTRHDLRHGNPIRMQPSSMPNCSDSTTCRALTANLLF